MSVCEFFGKLVSSPTLPLYTHKERGERRKGEREMGRERGETEKEEIEERSHTHRRSGMDSDRRTQKERREIDVLS